MNMEHFSRTRIYIEPGCQRPCQGLGEGVHNRTEASIRSCELLREFYYTVQLYSYHRLLIAIPYAPDVEL